MEKNFHPIDVLIVIKELGRKGHGAKSVLKQLRTMFTEEEINKAMEGVRCAKFRRTYQESIGCEDE